VKVLAGGTTVGIAQWIAAAAAEKITNIECVQKVVDFPRGGGDDARVHVCGENFPRIGQGAAIDGDNRINCALAHFSRRQSATGVHAVGNVLFLEFKPVVHQLLYFLVSECCAPGQVQPQSLVDVGGNHLFDDASRKGVCQFGILVNVRIEVVDGFVQFSDLFVVLAFH